jgi:hypothetical protein
MSPGNHTVVKTGGAFEDFTDYLSVEVNLAMIKKIVASVMTESDVLRVTVDYLF